MMKTSVLLLALASIHCGDGRTELGVNVFEDATTTPLDDASVVRPDGGMMPDSDIVFGPDATTPVEAGPPCTKPVVQVGLAGDNISCKFHVPWTCGATKFDVGGACWPPGSKQGSGIEASCQKNGAPTGTVTNPDPKSCSCTDPAQTASSAALACGFSSGQ